MFTCARDVSLVYQTEAYRMTSHMFSSMGGKYKSCGSFHAKNAMITIHPCVMKGLTSLLSFPTIF